MEGPFASDPSPPWNFHPRGYVSYPPATHGISIIFELGWVPSGKNICVKNVVALYYHAKDNFFCDKMRKNLSFHVNTYTVSNNLKNVLSE